MSIYRLMTIRHHKLFRVLAFSVVFLLAAVADLRSSSAAEQTDELSTKEQKEIIETLCQRLEKLYPVTEVGRKTSAALRTKFEEGAYSDDRVPSVFVQRINNDLISISGDGHLSIWHDPAMASQLKADAENRSEVDTDAELSLASERWKNFGFKELKILEGNIGYLDLRTFYSVKHAGPTAVAAMDFFSNSNGMIVDLRRNGGGWDNSVTFLASYFLGDDADLIFGIKHSTLDDSYYVSMRYSYVPGKSLADIPLYVLTSKSTASAAEAFTSIMKNFKNNTTVVGETTAGAEYPVESLYLFDEYVLSIPCWQTVYSHDETGWEGTGIEPDIEIEGAKALTIAHLELLGKLKKHADDEVVRSKYQWAIDGVNASCCPVAVSERTLRSYGGKYGSRDIYYAEGELYYQYKGRAKRRMHAISTEYFLIEGYDFFRVRFVTDKEEVRGIIEIFDDGRITELSKE